MPDPTPTGRPWPPSGYLCVAKGNDGCPGHPSKWMTCADAPTPTEDVYRAAVERTWKLSEDAPSELVPAADPEWQNGWRWGWRYAIQATRRAACGDAACRYPSCWHPERGCPRRDQGSALLGDHELAALERMRELIDSYPPGSWFARSGAQALFRHVLDGSDE